ncbi:MAG: FG-GAP repeat protein [Alphaproteobacteria bacterium]|nr:FG-GAP repeat protein [Alphaproteobacteria bacterium]
MSRSPQALPLARLLLPLALMACFEEEEKPDATDTDTTPDTPGDSGTPTTPKPGDRDGDGSPDDEDCAPDDPAVHPGAEEICFDSIDNDCDGAFTIGCLLPKGVIEAQHTHGVLQGHIDDLEAGTAVALGILRPNQRASVLIGAPGDRQSEHPGAVYLLETPFFGTQHLGVLGAEILGEEDKDNFGAAVAFVHDRDENGVSELVVGAPYAEYGDGAVYVFEPPNVGHYTIDGPATLGVAHAKLIGGRASRAGASLATGDFGGGAGGDIAIGAPDWSEYDARGAVYLLFDGPLTTFPPPELPEVADEILFGALVDEPIEHYLLNPGQCVANAGRLLGAGRDGLLLSNGLGYTYVLDTSTVGAPDFSLAHTPLVEAGDVAMGAGGDLTGDGVTDFLIASSCVDIPALEVTCTNAVLVMSGATDFYKAGERFDHAADRARATRQAQAIFVPGEDSYLGVESEVRSVTGAGDVNGDGHDDLLIGDPGADGFHGAVYLFLGPVSGILRPEDAYLTITGDEGDSMLGWSVASGDINGDHLDDFVMGAPGDGKRAGAVYVIYGGRAR